jgi:TolA-binding protein
MNPIDAASETANNVINKADKKYINIVLVLIGIALVIWVSLNNKAAEKYFEVNIRNQELQTASILETRKTHEKMDRLSDTIEKLTNGYQDNKNEISEIKKTQEQQKVEFNQRIERIDGVQNVLSSKINLLTQKQPTTREN